MQVHTHQHLLIFVLIVFICILIISGYKIYKGNKLSITVFIAAFFLFIIPVFYGCFTETYTKINYYNNDVKVLSDDKITIVHYKDYEYITRDSIEMSKINENLFSIIEYKEYNIFKQYLRTEYDLKLYECKYE